MNLQSKWTYKHCLDKQWNKDKSSEQETGKERRKKKKGWGERRKTTEKQEAKNQEIICLRSIGQFNLFGTEHKLEIRYVRVI